MSEVNECHSQAKFEITEEELLNEWGRVSCTHLEWLEDKERLNNWILIMEDVVKAVQDAYRMSFRLLESGNFKNEPNLDNLRNVLISLMAELQVVKSWRL
jgi:hypothetical protein